MALPERRIRTTLGAAVVALVLTAPGLIADPHGFLAAQRNASAAPRFVDAWSVWYPLAGSTPGTAVPGADGRIAVAPSHGGSAAIGALAHPLIVVIALILPPAMAIRRRRLGCSGSEAMALLALLALLRCVLDPVDNLYYQLPLLLALLGWDALHSRGLPLRGLAAVAVAMFLRRWSPYLDPPVLNAAYLAVVLPAGAAIALALARSRSGPARARPRVAIAPARAARAG
jgi:hypothetical protein